MMLHHIKAFFSISRDKPELALAQFAAFSKQVPLLYLMLVANTLALSATHFAIAPLSRTVVFPAVLSMVCVFRLVGWCFGRNRSVSAEQAIGRLRATIRLAIVLGIAFTGWAFSLYPFGDQLHQAHVAFYMSITIIGCIFCLMHLRAAAVLLVFIVLGPFTLFFSLTHNLVFQAVAVNVLLVSAALLYVLNIYYKDFATLIDSRKEILLRQQETERLSDENLRLANLDSLTGLSNRRWFIDTLERDLRAARAEGRRLAIGMVDLDGFKPVNDAYGHAAGDRVLMEVARRLKRATGETMKVARLGGDEFGLIMPEAGDRPDSALRAAASLIEDLQQPYDLPDVSVHVGASIGLAFFPEAGQTAAELFEHADYALYNAKQTGRGQAVLFNAELSTEIAHRSLVEQELRRADLAREFSILYQPLWSETEGRTYAFEALARWNSPHLGPVSPAVFIQVAERSGMIGTLTQVLFAKAIEEACLLPDNVEICCNLSAKDVECARTLERLLQTLRQTGFDPRRLVIELTETAMLKNTQTAFRHLQMLRAHGIGIALDDFGVGQSSLSQVHRLPISKIKIDQSFVADVDTNPVSRNIIRTILDLARNVGCACVVEGVETPEQAAALGSLGCSLMQGYHHGRPMPITAALARLEQEASASRTGRLVLSS